MKTLHIYCIAFICLLLQSCSSTQAENATINPELNSNTQLSAIAAPSDVAFIDTTLDETIIFVNSVDDMNGYAYGRIYNVEEAQVTEFLVTVPYSCIRYDNEDKHHYLLTRRFNTVLNHDSTSLARIEITSKSLVGFDNDN